MDRKAGALVLCLVASPLGAQALRIPNGRAEREIIVSAEAEGAAYPRGSRAAERNGIGRRCVVASDVYPFVVRSGDFEIGGDLGGYLGYVYRYAALRAGRRGKVWWHPDHGGPDMPPLVVRGRSLTNFRDTLRYTTSNVATPSAPGQRVPPGKRDYFFPSGIAFPQSGRWLVIATSGANWGCFIITVI